jgi:hypothetical protein
VENGEEPWSTPAAPVHRDMAAFKVGKPFVQKPLRKKP